MTRSKEKKYAINIPEKKIAQPFVIWTATDKLEKFRENKVVFAFDHIQFNSSECCFNHQDICRADFLDLMDGLKKLSKETYGNIVENRNRFHYHEVRNGDGGWWFTENKVRKALGSKNWEIPTILQIWMMKGERRIVWFLYSGIFYIIWYDRDHIIYPRQ